MDIFKSNMINKCIHKTILSGTLAYNYFLKKIIDNNLEKVKTW